MIVLFNTYYNKIIYNYRYYIKFKIVFLWVYLPNIVYFDETMLIDKKNIEKIM